MHVAPPFAISCVHVSVPEQALGWFLLSLRLGLRVHVEDEPSEILCICHLYLYIHVYIHACICFSKCLFSDNFHFCCRL